LIIVIQALPMIALVAPFFAVFVVSHRDYRNICRDIDKKRREVNNLSIPDKSTDVSVDSFEKQYAREVLASREEASDNDLTPAEQAELDALVRGLGGM